VVVAHCVVAGTHEDEDGAALPAPELELDFSLQEKRPLRDSWLPATPAPEGPTASLLRRAYYYFHGGPWDGFVTPVGEQ
jgi:hypothetical protein